MMNTHSALAQMNRLRDELDHVFGADALHWARAVAHPPVNIWEDENGFYAEAELPGLSMEDLEIYIHEGDELTIKGVRKQAEIEGTWRRHERVYGEFSRKFKLPDVIDVEKVSAELKDGILTIALPKIEAVKPKKIEVKVTS
jgi:HSP20 family protein